MSARSFCTVTASTKRNADLGSGRTGAPATNLASLAITPLWPLDGGAVQSLAISSPREYLMAFHVPDGEDLPDVAEGDMLTVAGIDYPIQYVDTWTDGDVPSLRIVVQKVQGT